MYKKLLCSILAVSMVMSAVCISTVYAFGNTKAVERAEILTALGIWEDDAESDKVTREKFYKSILSVIYGPEEITNVAELSAVKGLVISPDKNSFNGSAYISYNDAVAAAVTALGYDEIAKINGYPGGYRKIAAQLGLLDDVVGDRTTPILKESAVNLLYNMISAEPMELKIDGVRAEHTVLTGETLIGIERNIYEFSGVVTANEYTSLINPEGSFPGTVTVGEDVYFTGNSGASEYLGKNVEGFVRFEDNNSDGEILYIRCKPEKNNEITINSDDIQSVDNKFTNIGYFDGIRNKSAKLDDSIRVIYNGKFYDKYNVSDFHPSCGELNLIDNDDNGKYDVVFINSYDTMIVNNVSSYDGEIFGKYNYDGAFNYLDVSERNTNEIKEYFMNGEKAKLSDISSGDILSVAKSKSIGEVLVRIYISKNIVRGMCTAVDNRSGDMVINDTKYKTSDEYYAELRTVSGGTLQMSEEYDFYIDYFGRVVCAKKADSSDYCLFYKAYTDDIDETNHIIFLNDSNEWRDAELSKYVTFNGERQKSGFVVGELASCNPQIMVIKQNPDNKVNNIIIAEDYGTSGAKFTKIPNQSMTYRSTNQSFDCRIFLDAEAKVFVIPTDIDSAKKEDYYVTNSGYFGGDKKYTVGVYNIDRFNFTKVVSVIGSKTAKLQSGMFVVTGVGEKLDENGDVTSTLTGSRGKYINIELPASETGIFDNLKKGDVININMNLDEKIDYVKVITNLNNDFMHGMTSDIYSNINIVSGSVLDIDLAENKMKINCGEDVFMRINQSTGCLIYDSHDNICYLGTVNDISIGDKIMIRTNWGAMQEIVIVKN